MTILEQLEALENSTEAEKNLIAYILKYPEEFLQGNTSQIAARSFVSVSTMYRLCDKLGFSGLAQFKLKIASEIHGRDDLEDDSFNYSFPFESGHSMNEVIDRLSQDYQKTLKMTHELLDEQELLAAAKALRQAEIIDIYAFAGNLYFARNFQFQLMELGAQVLIHEGEYEQRLQASVSNEKHVAVMISFGGRGLLFYWIMDILQKRKVPVILIGSDENPVLGLADYNLQMFAAENHHTKISSFSTRASLLFILDALYSAYFTLDYDGNFQKKEEFYKIACGKN